MVKKLKLIILDDNPESMDQVIQCALRHHKDLFLEEVVEQVEQLIDIKRCSYVSEAMEACKRFGKDLVFTDLKIASVHETNPEVLKTEFQGLYFIHWLKKTYPNTLPIKVHSQYADQYEIQRELDRYGISIMSNFSLSDDFVPGDKLRHHFPELLQNIAKNTFNAMAKSASLRTIMKEQLDSAIRKKQFDLPLPKLGGFSVHTLLAGWLYLDMTAMQTLELRWTIDPLKALEELVGPQDASRPPALTGIGFLRERPNYAELSRVAQGQAAEVLKAFFEKWEHTSIRRLAYDLHNLKVECRWLEDTRHGIESLDHLQYDDDEVIKVLRMRLILGGIYELRDRLQPCLQQKIIDCGILGCLRNSAEEMMESERKLSQVKKYLSFMRLSKARNQGEAGQILNRNAFHEDELMWLNSLRKTTLSAKK